MKIRLRIFYLRNLIFNQVTKYKQLKAQIPKKTSCSLKTIHSRSNTNMTGARGFILLLPQTAALPGSDAGSGVIKPASSFVIQNCQTSKKPEKTRKAKLPLLNARGVINKT